MLTLEIPEEINRAAWLIEQWAEENSLDDWAIRGICSRAARESLEKISSAVPLEIRTADFVRDVSEWLEDFVVGRSLTDEERQGLSIKFQFHTKKPFSDADLVR